MLAITRGETEVLLPVGREVVGDDDILALTGTTEAIDRAGQMLEMGW